MSMKLYELTGTMARIIGDIERAEAAGDEGLVEALQNALDEWGDDTRDKLVNVAKYRESLLAEAAAIKAVADKQAARAKAITNRAEWLAGYVIRSMRAASLGTVETPELLLRVKSGSGSVEITDETKVPEQFWRIKTVKELNKADLNETLKQMAKNGKKPELPGARLVFNDKLEVK